MMTGSTFGGPMLLGGLGMVLIWGFVIAGVAWFAIRRARGATIVAPAMIIPFTRAHKPADILEARLARRELTQDEYDRAKHNLGT